MAFYCLSDGVLSCLNCFPYPYFKTCQGLFKGPYGRAGIANYLQRILFFPLFLFSLKSHGSDPTDFLKPLILKGLIFSGAYSNSIGTHIKALFHGVLCIQAASRADLLRLVSRGGECQGGYPPLRIQTPPEIRNSQP